MGKLKMRYNKVAFYGIPSGSGDTLTYTRMHGFTEMSESKNPSTYERKYVDKKTSDTDITGFAPSISFNFDEHEGDPVCADMVNIIDNEKVGSDAVRSIVVVDFSDKDLKAYERKWSVISDTQGDGTDAYTYSGTLNCKSEKVWGSATVTTPTDGNNETAEVITFTADTNAE